MVGFLAALLGVGLAEDHAVFVAAEPGDDVALAGVVEQDLPDLAQRGIAGAMTFLVVDLLQAVEVEVDQHRWTIIALAMGHGASLFSHESPAVIAGSVWCAHGQPPP